MIKPPPAFAGLEGLLEHGPREGVEVRPTLLRALTDLYLQKPTHTVEDERYYTELALRLINSTEVSTRAVIAQRLATYPAAPRPVIERLARDVIEVATPILRHSPCLAPADLAMIASDCGPSHATVIAARAAHGQRLVDRSETRIGSESIAATQSAAELNELFFSATSAERRLILINLDYAPPASLELSETQSKECIHRLETAALRHNTEAFMHELENALGISSPLARRIANDELGESILAAAKALRMPRDVLQRILLFVNPVIGQSVKRVYELTACYDEISPEAAERLVAIWRDVDPRRRESPGQPSSRRATEPIRSAAPPAVRRFADPRDRRWRSQASD
jgi:hypothetical protein